jgi:hypothetical protein
MPPTPIRPPRRALERGRRSPRREDGRLVHARTGLRRDVRTAGPVTFVVIGPVRPSRALHHHLLHCGGTRRQDAATPDDVRPAASHQTHPRANVRTTTEREVSTPSPSKPFLDGHRTRHDVPPEARFARTAVYSTTLYTMTIHVDKTVRHAFKLPPPWPIKGEAVCQPQGGRRTTLTCTLSAFTTILALASISTSRTWRLGLLSRLACSPPPQALRCNTI